MKTEASLSVGAALVGFDFGGNFALFPSATAIILQIMHKKWST